MFSATPTSGINPLAVAFTDLTTGDVTSWAWDFGDGGRATLQSPSPHLHDRRHVHGFPDRNRCRRLEPVDPGGPDYGLGAASDCRVQCRQPTSGTNPLAVAFTDLTTGNVASWAWDFGDGGSSTLQNPSHTYTTVGTYTVSLTATGAGGSNLSTQVDLISAFGAASGCRVQRDADLGHEPAGRRVHPDLTNGSVASWSWDFGDGGSSALQNPSHTYTVVGTYTVALTATGAGGSNLSTQVDLITVSEPPPAAAFSATPTSGINPLAVAFTDLTTGNVASWAWDFGDGGSSALQNPSHTYTVVGTYTVALTATGAGGSNLSTQVDLITVSEPPPAAAFSATPTSGINPLAVAFTDLTTGNVASWAWDFGDGGSSTLQNPSHTYTVVGTYTVSLTATGAGGSHVATQVDLITVSEAAPVAAILATPTSGAAPLAVSFTDLSTGNVSSWSWDFGDGGSSSLQNPAHTYTTAGTYTVSLSVSGSGGADVAVELGVDPGRRRDAGGRVLRHADQRDESVDRRLHGSLDRGREQLGLGLRGRHELDLAAPDSHLHDRRHVHRFAPGAGRLGLQRGDRHRHDHRHPRRASSTAASRAS